MRPAVPQFAVLYAVCFLNLVVQLARASTDTCANIQGAAITVPFWPFGPQGVTVTFGPFGSGSAAQCLCLSGIQIFEESDALAEEANSIDRDPAATTAALTSLVNERGVVCTYPDNALPACTPDNPCNFSCTSGLTPSPADNPTECTCLPPNMICNGVCGDPSLCGPQPSSGVTPPSRRAEMIEQRAVATCRGQRLTACGVYGAKGWECVDTQSDLESCGGCIFPFGYHGATGVDCTTLVGVMDVSCRSGSCFVESCQSDYNLEGNSRCLPSTTKMVEDAIALLVPLRRRFA